MTNWELGNDIMCNLVDKMVELSAECESTNPQVAELLNELALDFGPLVNRLMNEDNHWDGMCPTRLSSYKFFDGTRNSTWDPNARV